MDEKKHLQTELETMQQQIEELSQKLHESEAFKSHFIARVSNEIVNPFTAIITMSSSILKADEGNWEKVRKMARHIHKEARFLQFQLNNLFAAARIESGEVEPEIVRTKLNTLIEGCVEEIQQAAEKKDIRIIHKSELPDGLFSTDAEKVRLILFNLIDNAIKYSKPETEIVMSSELSGGEFVFAVQNEGERISKEDAAAMFDRFKRLNDKIHSLNPGSGLGLSISAELAELLEGSLIAEETSNGMRFMLRVPESEMSPGGFDLSGDELFFDDNEEEQVL